MSWVTLDENVYAEIPTHDPKQIVDKDQLNKILSNKLQKLTIINNEITWLQNEKNTVELEILEIQNLL